MQAADVLDTIGALVAQLKAYAFQLPPIVNLASVPTGVKPKPEAIEDYEKIVGRIRAESTGTRYKILGDFFIESLEAFEGGKLLGSVQSMLSVLDHLERMQRDKEIEAGRITDKRIAEYRTTLRSILPGNKPELDSIGR